MKEIRRFWNAVEVVNCKIICTDHILVCNYSILKAFLTLCVDFNINVNHVTSAAESSESRLYLWLWPWHTCHVLRFFCQASTVCKQWSRSQEYVLCCFADMHTHTAAAKRIENVLLSMMTYYNFCLYTSDTVAPCRIENVLSLLWHIIAVVYSTWGQPAMAILGTIKLW